MDAEYMQYISWSAYHKLTRHEMYMKCNSYSRARKTTIIQERLTTSIDPTKCPINVVLSYV